MATRNAKKAKKALLMCLDLDSTLGFGNCMRAIPPREPREASQCLVFCSTKPQASRLSTDNR